MEENHRRFLPAPRGSTVRNTLVGMVGVFTLIWLYYQHAVTDPVQLYGVEIAATKDWVRNKARDPSSVNFEDIKVYNNELREVSVNFSWNDGQAGKTEKRWRFDFNRETGRLLFVNDEETGKMVGYGDEALEHMRAEAAGKERFNQVRTKAAQKEAEWRMSNLPVVPGAAPPPEKAAKTRYLPPVPGMEGR